MALLERTDRLRLVEGDHHPDLRDVRFRYSEGHTVGLMLSLIEDVAVVADLIPGTPWLHLPVAMGYDRYPRADRPRENVLLKRRRGQQVAPLFHTRPPLPLDPHRLRFHLKRKFLGAL